MRKSMLPLKNFTKDVSMLKKIAYLFGIVLLGIGILGFLPAATPGGLLLGVFHVNTLHNWIHIVTGLLAFVAASDVVPSFTSKLYFQLFGVIYGVVALLGFYYGDNPIFGLIANNQADNFLHVVIALVSLYLGFVYSESRKYKEV